MQPYEIASHENGALLRAPDLSKPFGSLFEQESVFDLGGVENAAAGTSE
jgi:hypothetical protein